MQKLLLRIGKFQFAFIVRPSGFIRQSHIKPAKVTSFSSGLLSSADVNFIDYFVLFRENLCENSSILCQKNCKEIKRFEFSTKTRELASI